MDHRGPRSQVLAELQERLLQPHAVTEHFHGLAVVDDDHDHPGDCPGIGVRLRWRDDPTTYCVVLPVRIQDDGRVTRLDGETGWPGWDPPDTAALASEAGLLLLEELDTGLTRRSRGTLTRGSDDGQEVVHLDVADTLDVMPNGICVSSVWWGDGDDAVGEHLEEVGLSTAAQRTALRERRLVSLLHAYVNNHVGEPYVGDAAVAWEPGSLTGPGGTVRVVALQLHLGTPASVAQALLFHALRDARDRGAVTALVDDDVTAAHGAVLAEVGFVPAPTGSGLVLVLSDQRWPDLPA